MVNVLIVNIKLFQMNHKVIVMKSSSQLYPN